LRRAILENCSPQSVIGIDPSDGFLATARQSLGTQVEIKKATADAIPLADQSVDVVVSGLMLNFVPQPAVVLAEMERVAKARGTIGVYLWDYADRMEMLRMFWDAALELDASAAKLDEGQRFPICRLDCLKQEFEEAGLTDIQISAIDVPTVFRDFDDFWHPFLAGQGPAPTYVVSLPEEKRNALRERLRLRLPVHGDGSIRLLARAWAAKAQFG
jgi:SAM-dependent methyltransferase